MALENVQIYRIASGDDTYPHFGNFTITVAGKITVDDSNGQDDSRFGDYTHTGGFDVPDQDVTASTVTGVDVGDKVDLRYKYTFTGSDGSSGTVYFLATNQTNDYGPLIASNTPLDPAVTYRFRNFNTDGAAQYSTLVPCFVKGTMITTEFFETRVEDLRVGDRVLTADHGLQQIKWIGARALDRIDLLSNPKLRPIRIKAGALGLDTPSCDLLVSPQHRMLVSSRIAERLFGAQEVLVPAIKLAGLPGIEITQDGEPVEYFHILFDDHQIIFADGAATESLYTGPEAIRSISPEARAELLALFPELADIDHRPTMARPVPTKGQLVRRMVERHAANGHALQ